MADAVGMPADFERLVEGLELKYRLGQYAIDDNLEWIVPPGMLDGVTQAYGMPVRHVAGIEAPYLAHRLTERTTELL